MGEFCNTDWQQFRLLYFFSGDALVFKIPKKRFVAIILMSGHLFVLYLPDYKT